MHDARHKTQQSERTVHAVHIDGLRKGPSHLWIRRKGPCIVLLYRPRVQCLSIGESGTLACRLASPPRYSLQDDMSTEHLHGVETSCSCCPGSRCCPRVALPQARVALAQGSLSSTVTERTVQKGLGPQQLAEKLVGKQAKTQVCRCRRVGV